LVLSKIMKIGRFFIKLKFQNLGKENKKSEWFLVYRSVF
jgi:hypothetical protein